MVHCCGSWALAADLQRVLPNSHLKTRKRTEKDWSAVSTSYAQLNRPTAVSNAFLVTLGYDDGMWDAYSVKIGDRSFWFVGIGVSEEKLVSVSPQMIEHLNSVRDFFEDLSPELGETAPVSGLVVVTHKG